MMKVERKWIKVVGLALSLPSTIFASAFFINVLVEKQLISQLVGLLIFLAIIGNIFYLIIYHAYKNKD